MEVWPQRRALLMQYTRGGLLISEQRMMSVVSLSPMTAIKITVTIAELIIFVIIDNTHKIQDKIAEMWAKKSFPSHKGP